MAAQSNTGALSGTWSWLFNTKNAIVQASHDTWECRLILMRKLPLPNSSSALISQPIHDLWAWNHTWSPCEERVWCVTGLGSLEPKLSRPGRVPCSLLAEQSFPINADLPHKDLNVASVRGWDILHAQQWPTSAIYCYISSVIYLV